MAWITGTGIADYRAMLDEMITNATSDHLASVSSIVAGGTGYAVDDIITFTDGTFTKAAKLRVTSVSSCAITGVRVEEGGAYTVDPDLTANSSHTNSGSGNDDATFDLTMNSEPWTVERRAQEAVSATAATAGSGYTVGDDVTLTMDGGGVLGATGEGSTYGVAPVFNVDSVDGGGGITGLSLVTAGHLEETPDVDTGTGGLQANVTGGTGTGAVLTVTYQDVGSSQEDVVVLSAPGTTGSEQILTAFRTFQATDESTFNTCFNWQLFGLVEFNSGLALHAQNNISYGLDAADGSQETDGGCFMVLKEDDSDPDISYWMSVNNRRIILICKVETATTTHYSAMYVGHLDPFGTSDEAPYPLWIQGCTSRENSWWGDTVIGRISGLSDVYGVSGKLNGPAQYRVGGSWETFHNYSCNDGGSPSRSATSDFIVFPTGVPTRTPQSDDEITDNPVNGLDFEDIFPTSGSPGVPNVLFRPTPNTGDDSRPLLPLSPLATDNPTNPVSFVYTPYGQLNNCFWVSASDSGTDLSSESTVKIGDDRYRVFQNGNQTQAFSFFAVKEE